MPPWTSYAVGDRVQVFAKGGKLIAVSPARRPAIDGGSAGLQVFRELRVGRILLSCRPVTERPPKETPHTGEKCPQCRRLGGVPINRSATVVAYLCPVCNYRWLVDTEARVT